MIELFCCLVVHEGGREPSILRCKWLLGLLWLIPMLVSAEDSSYRIIDMHAHALPPTFQGEPGAIFPPTGEVAPSTEEAIMQKSFDAMQRNNVVAALLSGPLMIVDRWVEASPIRLLGSPKFPVYGPWPDIEDLRDRYDHGKLHALGEITGAYAGIRPDSPALEPYFALAQELDLPVAIHLGQGPPEEVLRRCCPDFDLSAGNPLLLEPVLKRHPALRLYACHMGRPFVEEMMAIMQVYSRVYVDISGVNTDDGFREYILRFIRHGFGRRLMFGSDQMIWPGNIDRAVRRVLTANYLSEAQKRDILFNNAARFLRIDEGNSSTHPDNE